MLTVAQAAHLRTLAAPYARDGREHPLTNLAYACREVREERWPELVAAHFSRLEQASTGGETAEELLRDVHARLLPVDALGPELAAAMRYARVVAEGLVFAYALDGPTSVRILTDADVERAGLENLGQAAYANLLRVPVEHEAVPAGGRARLHSLYGDSPFVASKALFLSAAVRQVTGAPLPDAGALVAVPNRHLLAYHPITDGSVVDAVNALADLASAAYEDGPGALSPRVYWWHRGGLTSLTVIDQDTRTFALRPPPPLLALMKGLVRLDRAGRLATGGATRSPDTTELTHRTAESLARLADSPAEAGRRSPPPSRSPMPAAPPIPTPRTSTRGTRGPPPYNSAAPCSPAGGRRSATSAPTSSGNCPPSAANRPRTPVPGSTPSTWRSCAANGTGSPGCARCHWRPCGRTTPSTPTCCTGSTPCRPTSPSVPRTTSWKSCSPRWRRPCRTR